MNNEPTPEEILEKETEMFDELELKYSRRLIDTQNELLAIQKQREQSDKKYKKNKALQQNGEILLLSFDVGDCETLADFVKRISNKY